jgi:CubicO group peptidase (beta-lactamase class C family)
MIEMVRARAVLGDAVSARIFPGAVVEVGHAGGPLAATAEGRLTYEIKAAPVDGATIYDLASLTKVLATTTLALELVSDGRLALDDRVSHWINAWRGDDRAAVTVRHLLDHSSGLPAHRRYFERLQGREAFEQAICAEPLEYPPGSLAMYSDAGFMLLGFVLEEAGGAPLDRQFDKWRVQHLGSDALLQYRPPDTSKSRIAPTEDDPWRGRMLRGEVHDENAAALDGVAAHAGLFGTAASVGAAARWWLRAVASRDRDEENSLGVLARRFVSPSGVPGSSRALGWDTMRPTSSCGSRLSSAAFGHTGFTGTSLWVDPAWRAGRGPDTPDGLYVVFLSNRVHPSRSGDGMTRVRQALHDAVADDLWRA